MVMMVVAGVGLSTRADGRVRAPGRARGVGCRRHALTLDGCLGA